jgi:hypothetical protein
MSFNVNGGPNQNLRNAVLSMTKKAIGSFNQGTAKIPFNAPYFKEAEEKSFEDSFIADEKAQELVLQNELLFLLVESRFNLKRVSVKITKEFYSKFKNLFKNIFWVFEKYPEFISKEDVYAYIDQSDDWTSISRFLLDLEVPFEIIDKHLEEVEWSYLDYRSKKLTEEFLDRYNKYIDWNNGHFYNKKLSLDFIKKYIANLNINQLVNSIDRGSEEKYLEEEKYEATTTMAGDDDDEKIERKEVSLLKFLYSEDERNQIKEFYNSHKDLL